MKSNRMESRATRAKTARGTLEILKKEVIRARQQEVALSEAMDFAVKTSQLIAPKWRGVGGKAPGGALGNRAKTKIRY